MRFTRILTSKKSGIGLTLLGVGMFFLGVHTFTYMGDSLNPIVRELGKYSFFLWLPTLVFGIVVTVIAFTTKATPKQKPKI